jgi:hypothetical protein
VPLVWALWERPGQARPRMQVVRGSQPALCFPDQSTENPCWEFLSLVPLWALSSSHRDSEVQNPGLYLFSGQRVGGR